MSISRVICVIGSVLVGCNVAFAAQVSGQTRTDAELQGDTIRTSGPALAQIAKSLNCNPTEYTLVETNIISEPETGKWQEAWTFHLCDRQVLLPIAFIKNPNGPGYMIDIDVQHSTVSLDSKQ